MDRLLQVQGHRRGEPDVGGDQGLECEEGYECYRLCVNTSREEIDTESTLPRAWADPYTAQNKESPELKEKVEVLVSFIEQQKFCMMTTRVSNGLLASRFMVLAAKARLRYPRDRMHSTG